MEMFPQFLNFIVPLQADEYKCVFLEALPVQISMNAEYNAKTRWRDCKTFKT